MTHQDITMNEWRELRIDGYMGQLGPLLRSVRHEEKNTYGLQAQARHCNHIGLVHGGVLTGLLDQVMAMTAWKAADKQPTVTVQMDTRFLGAARAGSFLLVRAAIRHLTRSLIFVDGEIVSGNTSVANATAVMKISTQAGQNA